MNLVLFVGRFSDGRNFRLEGDFRDRNLLGKLSPEASLRVLDLVDRSHAAADALGQCGEMLHVLRIERYWGDYAL
jgi:hypothetical protein